MAQWTEKSLRLYLRSGAVFYFQDRELTSPFPHFFVVVNDTPLSDEYLVLTVSSSQVDTVRARRKLLPSVTLVEIEPSEYMDFTKSSIIDCNYVRRCSRAELLQRLNDGGEQKADLDQRIVKKVREGVLASPLIENEVKKLLNS